MNPPDRSYLFVPGDRPDRFDKALAADADAVILDLEDAVQPQRKREAHDAVAQWLKTTDARVFVRVNPQGTPWHEEDCRLFVGNAVRGVMLPKAEDPQGVALVARALQPGQELIALIETVEGHFATAAIAKVPGVTRLAFGSFDFLADAGMQRDEDLDGIRIDLVLQSRRANLPAPIDGVSLAVNDAACMERDTRRSRQLGFGGKLCIHPGQVAPAHAGFAPLAEEIAWAHRVLAAMSKGPLGAIAVDGKLIDKPLLLRAEALLRDAKR